MGRQNNQLWRNTIPRGWVNGGSYSEEEKQVESLMPAGEELWAEQ